MSTNANSRIIASIFADARSATNASFTSLVQRLQGKLVGRGADRKRHGDHLTIQVVVAGAIYTNTVLRSQRIALGWTDENLQVACDAANAAGKVAWEGRGKKATSRPLTLADFQDARDRLLASFERTLDPSQPSASTTAHVYEPLFLDGEKVRGARVYRCVADDPEHECKCRECSGDAKAPLDGTVYLQGLKVWSKILDEAPNGSIPPSKSGGRVVAERWLKRDLPVGAYVSYRLEPGGDWILKAGGTAKCEATAKGFEATPELLEVLDAN